MLNFSKTGLIDDLITEILGLTGGGGTEAEQALYKRAKRQAVGMLKSTQATNNGAHINLRAAIIWPLNAQQLEIQINGRKI